MLESGMLHGLISNCRIILTYVFFDVLKIRRLLESLYIPVKILQPLVNDGVICANGPQVAFEMLDVDGVKPYNRCVRTNI